jgi:hypothetical protein
LKHGLATRLLQSKQQLRAASVPRHSSCQDWNACKRRKQKTRTCVVNPALYS